MIPPIPTELTKRPHVNPLTPSDYVALDRAAELLVYYGDGIARAQHIGLDVAAHVAAHEAFAQAHTRILQTYPNPQRPLQNE